MHSLGGGGEQWPSETPGTPREQGYPHAVDPCGPRLPVRWARARSASDGTEAGGAGEGERGIQARDAVRAEEADVPFTPYDAAFSFKATFPRVAAAVDFGDTDFNGWWRHGPLLDVDLPK